MLQASAFPRRDQPAIAPVEAVQLELAAIEPLQILQIGPEADAFLRMPSALLGQLRSMAKHDAAYVRIGRIVQPKNAQRGVRLVTKHDGSRLTPAIAADDLAVLHV